MQRCLWQRQPAPLCWTFTALVSAAVPTVRFMTLKFESDWIILQRCSSSSWLCLHLSLLTSPLTSLHSLPLHALCKSSHPRPVSIQPSCSVTMDICSRLTSCASLSIAFTLAVFMAFAFRLSCWCPVRTPSLILFSFLWRPATWVQLSANEIWMSDFPPLIFCVPVTQRKKRKRDLVEWSSDLFLDECLCRTNVVCLSSKR